MGLIAFVLLYWIIIYYGIGYGLPLLGMALSFFGLVLQETMQLISKGIGWIAFRLIRCTWLASLQVGRAFKFIAVLSFFWIAEFLFPSPDPSHCDDTEDESEFGHEPGADFEKTEAVVAAYEAAVRLLGLRANFAKTELRKAYITAIKAAHPDQGGDPELAREINVARDVVMDWNGWK